MTSKTKYTYLPYKPDGSGIFYPEQPDEFPDAMYQFPKLNHTMEILLCRWEDREDALVSGNNAIYYQQGNPRVHRSPDGFIAFGVDRDAILQENGYKVWEVGKPPDWVLEIASPSTARVDLGIKREIYASIGIGEYWRLDCSGGKYYGEPLVGEFLQDGEYRRFEIQTSEDGVAWGYSPILNLDIYWGDIRLHYFDPVAGEWLLGLKEAQAELQEVRRRKRELEEELRRRG
jgi:Uma2 family endonuclease